MLIIIIIFKKTSLYTNFFLTLIININLQEQEEVIAVKRASVMEDLSKVEPAVLEAQAGKVFLTNILNIIKINTY